MKLTLEIKCWCPCSHAEHEFDLKVCVIAKRTPQIGCRVDLFLVAGITFLTCHLQAGKFSTINHGGATSIWEFLWQQGRGGMVQHYWHGSSPPVTADQNLSLLEESKENHCIMTLSIGSAPYCKRNLQLPTNTIDLFRRKYWKTSWK